MGGSSSKEEDNYVTRDEIHDITELQLTDYAKKTDLPSLSDYAKKSDLPSVSGYAKKSELTNFVSKNDPKCSLLLNGIHWCDKPLHSEVDTKSMTIKDVFQRNETQGFCVGVKNMDMGEMGNLPSSFKGSGDIPDNFLCVDKNILNEYSDAFVKRSFRDFTLDTHMNMKIGDMDPNILSDAVQLRMV